MKKQDIYIYKQINYIPSGLQQKMMKTKLSVLILHRKYPCATSTQFTQYMATRLILIRRTLGQENQ
jgi:hypothetical protein